MSTRGSSVTTKRALAPNNAWMGAFSGMASSHLAVARMVRSLLHSTTASFSGPVPWICRISAPSNLRLAAISSAAAIISPMILFKIGG